MVKIEHIKFNSLQALRGLAFVCMHVAVLFFVLR